MLTLRKEATAVALLRKRRGTIQSDNNRPAAAVIPASVAYIKVVAVKKLVVELRVRLNSRSKDCL